MKVSRLGVQSELQLPAYATVTAMPGPSLACNLPHSSQQHQIFNPLSEAGDQTHILMEASWIHFRCATMGLPTSEFKDSTVIGIQENSQWRSARRNLREGDFFFFFFR